MSEIKDRLRKLTKPSLADDKNLSAAFSLLKDVFDRVEGRHSNIPDCCIETFVAGRTYMEFKNELSEKDQRKLDQWGYVPCNDCFKKNKKQEILLNGTSDLGEMILALQTLIIKKVGKTDEKRTRKPTIR